MKYIVLFIAFLISSYGFSQPMLILSGENSNELSHSTTTGFEFVLNVGNLKLQKVKTEKGVFYKAFSEGFTPSLAEGMPELLTFNRLIEIPAGAEVQIEIEEGEETLLNLSNYGANTYLFPHQLSLEKREGATADFIFYKAGYQKDRFYSQPIAKVENLGLMRNIHMARLSISPFSYNPVTNQMKVIKKIKVKVFFKNGNLEETMLLKQKTFSPSFQLSKNELLNGKAFAFVPPVPGQYAETMLIIADSMFSTTLQPFIKMKQRQGFNIMEAYTQNPSVGNTKASIKAFVQGLYSSGSSTNPAPTYVLMVGDISKIPAYTGIAAASHITDFYYFEYTNDDFPELFYGRFSCDDTIELHNIIQKTMEYEQYLMPNPSYLDTSVLIAGYDNSHGATYGNGQVNYGTSNYYNVAHGFFTKPYLYPSSSTKASQIKQDASDGVALLNYSAHGNYNGWSNPSFKNNDVANMTNAHKYPIMIGNACLTGKFDASDCFGEVLTNAANKGAVGYIGASDNTYWDEDFYWAVGYAAISANPTYNGSGQGIFDGIFHDHGEAYGSWATSMAQICQKGNLAVTQGGSRVKYYWEVYHVFGDPSLLHYSYVPAQAIPTYNPLISIGLSSYNLSTFPYALVALSDNDSLVASAYADSLGDAVLNFFPFLQPTQLLLTITGQNKQPFSGTVNVISPNGPYLAYSSFTINDSLGNNNHRADNNESLKLNVEVKNLTQFLAGGVQMKLSSSDTSVIITDSLESISQFQGHDTLVFMDAFGLNVKQNVVDGRMVKFVLSITDTAGGLWTSVFYMPLYSPRLEIGSLSLDDVLGNNNGIADPGESISFYVEVSNQGSNDVSSGAVGQMMPQSPVLVGTNNPVQLANVKSDSSYYMAFQYVVSASAKVGEICKLNFDLTAMGIIQSKQFVIVIGSVDEDFETGDFSKFHWLSQKGNPWKIDNTVKYEGNYSAKSDSIGDSDTSGLVISLNVLMDDSISFYRQVSSEYTYDFLNFYIDGMLIDRWSGSKSWAKVTYPVTKGMHTFKWLYVKDYYDLDGLDAAWVDYIKFPPTDILSTVEEAKSVFKRVHLYPNPASSRTNLIFDLKEQSNVEISLYSQTGQLVRLIQSSQEFMPGNNTLLISTDDLPSGNYYVVLKTDNQTYTKKFIKIRN